VVDTHASCQSAVGGVEVVPRPELALLAAAAGELGSGFPMHRSSICSGQSSSNVTVVIAHPWCGWLCTLSQRRLVPFMAVAMYEVLELISRPDHV
jgi:hypothetical protein